eukprot:50899-Rhodomonas_salina.2
MLAHGLSQGSGEPGPCPLALDGQQEDLAARHLVCFCSQLRGYGGCTVARGLRRTCGRYVTEGCPPCDLWHWQAGLCLQVVVTVVETRCVEDRVSMKKLQS